MTAGDRVVYGSGSIGRAPDSKSGGWGFESLLPCLIGAGSTKLSGSVEQQC